MQEHEGKMHPVRFCGRVFNDAEMNYHPAEKEVLALLLLYTQLAGKTIHVYTRFSTLGWVHSSKSLFGRTAQFAVLLSPWHLIVTRLLQAGLTSFVDLEDSLSPTVRLDPQLLYARLPKSHQGFVVSFDGSAKTEKYGGYGICSWILWRLPEWIIVTAASAYLEATTVNMAEYSGMNRGVQAALDHGATELVIVGNSRLAIQQSLGETFWEVCRAKGFLTRRLLCNLSFDHNPGANWLSWVKASATTTSEARLSELPALNRISEVIYEPPNETSETESSVGVAHSQVQ
ncbi:hypothetical protein PHMEG_00035350, partial [Phytophthora megakarya]